jgi:dethiobiotin synthase
VKPFCAGSRDDIRFLQYFQQKVWPNKLVNPWYFPDPLAPLAAARGRGVVVHLEAVQDYIHSRARECELLLVEGAGGLLAPLGEGYSLADLVRTFQPVPVLIAAPNRLGVLNHVLLTLRVLRQAAPRSSGGVVLMERGRASRCSRSNGRLLPELVVGSPVFFFPWLGQALASPARLAGRQKKAKTQLKALAKWIFPWFADGRD